MDEGQGGARLGEIFVAKPEMVFRETLEAC